MATRSYQVREEDKDFLTLSANLGMSYDALRQANPSVQSLSLGQNINLPGSLPTQTTLGGGLNQPIASPAVTFNPRTGQGFQPPSMPDQPGALGGASATFSGFAPPIPAAYLGQGVYLGQGSGTSNPAQSNTSGDGRGGIPTALYKQNVETAAKQFSETNTLNPNTPPWVIANLIRGGADPLLIQQAMEAFDPLAASAATSAAGDPLAGTSGHYYVDEQTAPLVGTMLEINGKRRILRTDKEGRLYYQKPWQSKKQRARARARTREVNAEQRAAELAAQAIIPPTPDVNYRDAPVTALSVILGS